MVVKQVRGNAWNPIHVAPKLALFLTVHVRDNTVRSLPSPQVGVVQERVAQLRRCFHLCTWGLCCRHSHSCGSPSSSFFVLWNPSYGTENRRVLGLELLISLERCAANARCEDQWCWGSGSRGKRPRPRSTPEIFDLCLPLVVTRPLKNRFQGSIGWNNQFHTQERTAILLPQLTALFVYKFFPFLFYDAVVVRLMELKD